MERKGIVTVIDNPVTLIGPELKMGDKALSDHRDASFESAYGVLIKELRLLARAIFIVDRDDLIRHIEVVPELTHHPDYEKALIAVKKLI